MKKNVLSACAAVAYLAGCLLFLYAYPCWKPVLYFVSIAVSAVSAGLITWLYANKKPLLKALICCASYFAGFFGTAYHWLAGRLRASYPGDIPVPEWCYRIRGTSDLGC